MDRLRKRSGGFKSSRRDRRYIESPSTFAPQGFRVTQTSVGPSRQRSPGGLVHLLNGCRGDAEFGGDRVDRVVGDVEVNDRSLVPGDHPRLGLTRFADWLSSQSMAVAH